MLSRIAGLLLLVAVVIAIPLSHSALSAKKKATKKKAGPPPKVAICHFPDDSAVGHVIRVSRRAVPAHLSKHGDCLAFVARDNGACRCLTCEERCRAAFQRCLASGGSTEECEAELGRCLLGCVPCEERCQAEFERCLAAGNPEDECQEDLRRCLIPCTTVGDG